MYRQVPRFAAVAVAAMLAACGQQRADGGLDVGRARIAVQSLTETRAITGVVVHVSPAGLTETLTLNPVDGIFAGLVAVPAGEQTFTVEALNGVDVVGRGAATALISAGATASLTVRVLDTTGAAPTPELGPVVTSLVLSDALVGVGEPLTVTATAVDPDGDPLSYAWSQDCSHGGFADPSAASTTWTATAEGACTLTVVATGGSLSDSASAVVVAVSLGSGAASIDGAYIQHPVIQLVDLHSPNGHCSVHRFDANATCSDLVAQPGSEHSVFVMARISPQAGPTALTLEDNCGGTATSLYSPGPDIGEFLWRAPATPATCVLTAHLEHDGLVDTFGIGIIVAGESYCPDDLFEENDDSSMAIGVHVLPGVVHSEPDLRALDDDWYALHVETGVGAVDLNANGPLLSEPLQIEVYAADGVTLLYSGSAALTFSVSTPDLYFVRIFALTPLPACDAAYELNIVGIDAPACADDAYEDNDNFLTATPLPPLAPGMSHVEGNLQALDDDWYLVELSSLPDGELEVTMMPDLLPLRVEIYAEDGETLLAEGYGPVVAPFLSPVVYVRIVPDSPQPVPCPADYELRLTVW